MITKTIGSGGDYAGIKEALVFLASMNPIDDDYEFDLISDTVENFGVAGPAYNLYTGVNRNIITFKSSNNSTVTITSTSGIYVVIGYGSNQYPLHSGSLTFDEIKFVRTGLYGNATLYLGATISFFKPQRGFADIAVKNCVFIGANKTNAGLSFATWYINISILNNRFYNCSYGFSCSSGGGAGPDTIGLVRKIENCSFYDCATGLGGHNRSFIANNVVAISCSTVDFEAYVNASYTNCADSDNSIASSGAILSGNITGITDLDFLSVDPASADFLKIGKKRKWVRETVGLWKGENNGDDEINGNTASLGVGIGFEQGIVGNCFRMGTHTGTIAIPYHAAYNFGSNGFFSFEFYFKYEQFATAWIRFGCHIVSDDQFNGYWKRFAIVFKQGSISVGSNGNFPSQVYSNIPYNEFIKLRFMHGSGGRWELFVNDVLQTPSLYSNLPFIDLDDTAWNMRWDPEIYNISKLDEFAIINDRAYTSPSEEYSALYKTGTSDISAWNTADAFGKPRPDYRGSVSIGVHEPISANATLRVKIGGEYYSKKKAVTY
jgi:hypothetical protein